MIPFDLTQYRTFNQIGVPSMRKKRTDSKANRPKANNAVKNRFRLVRLMITMILTTGFLIACGGGGDDSSSSGSTDSSTSTVRALSMPDRISITSVDDSDSSRSAQSFSASKAGLFRAFDDPGTDYENQRKDVWVEDTDALDMVNDILAVVQDTGYEHFVNEDPYKALVKKVGDSEQSGGGTSTTATTTEELMEITVQVTRASNTAPMIVKVWVIETDGPGGAAMLIRGHFTVSEGVSDDYPYGQLEAHFVGVKLDANGAETDTETMHMAIKVDADDDGNVVVQCVDQGDEDNGSEAYEWNNRFRLVSNSDLSEGHAYVNAYEAYEHPGGSGEEDYVGYIAYNENYFKEKEADAAQPTVYDKNSLHRKVYRYKLFDADSGDKVSMSGGFPITLETGEYGYIGYWGLWVNDGVTVENGDTVTDMDGNAYTVFTVGGKLRKHTRTQVTLAQLTDVEMSMWDSTEGVDYIIAWDGTEFKKIGYRNNETGQVEYGEYGAVTFAYEWDGAWCEAFNAYMGLGRLYANDATPTDATTFSFHTEETIDPSTAEDWTFYYWGPVVGENHEEYWMSNPTAATMLTFNAADLVLEDNGTPLVDTTNGSWMSPLTTEEYTQENQWQAYDADIYYSWSTGPNQWDQYTALKNASNEFVSFTAPLQFTYVHSTDNDLNGSTTFDGKTFSLDYDGSELHIPWTYDADLDEWQPMFSLKDGVVLTDSESNTYVVKGAEVGVVMREATNPDDASDLVIDETIAPPTLTFDSSKTDLVGDKPSAELKVIKGELVD
jgi:hypothetical protein